MDGADHADDPAAGGEHIFAMDPEATLRILARHLVAGQQTMAALSRTASTLRSSDETPQTAHLLEVYDDTLQQWRTETLPSVAASMKLALEVYDTFGPGMTRVDDPTDAAIWNNKWFAWEWELSGRTAQ